MASENGGARWFGSDAKTRRVLKIKMKRNVELPIIQKCYDLIVWFVPVVNRLPRQHKFVLGDRIQLNLFGMLDELIAAKFESGKLARLVAVNVKLDVLRYQSRMLVDFELMDARRFTFVSSRINEIGVELGGWIRQQQNVRGAKKDL